MSNRLANETSPYLLQHRDNPVDWYPWGKEALERARDEDRPILLSVGYSACHWCHVMERESFEDSATARVMNERFVSIKVDREERPDVDGIYMSAVQQMTGQGGWPLTAFLLPTGEPFYGGTYFPPEPRHGMPSFRQILEGVSDAYRDRREDVDRSAAELRDALRRAASMRAPGPAPDTELLDAARADLVKRFDRERGGFGGAPKFPQPMGLEFLLRSWKRTGSAEALEALTITLHRMAAGGLYDHVGGGFHRYSVDAEWLVPHFEKMLYDNALLARVYLHAYQATGSAVFRRVVEETLEYVLREMCGTEGQFHATQDADSEGEEGRFYVWNAAEVDELLEADEAAAVREHYGVTQGGNFEGRNILHVPGGRRDVEKETDPTLRRARERLYRARAERVWPGRDEKTITAWNGMMLRAMAEAGRVLGRADFREAAVRNARFLLEHLRPEGRLLRIHKDGVAKIPAYLEDHALLADGLVSLYEATGEMNWLAEAGSLADTMLQRFRDEGDGIFYDAPAGADGLIVRPRDLYDNATPSGTSAAVTVLLRLAALTGESRYREAAEQVFTDTGELLKRAPSAFGQLLCALDFALAEPHEVVIVGAAEAAETAALTRVVNTRYLPNTVLALHDPDVADGTDSRLPLLRDRTPVDGRAAAYVCRRYACRRPVTEPKELARELDEEVD